MQKHRPQAHFKRRKRTRQQRNRLRVFLGDAIKQCEAKLPKVVVLTGAGVSAESGINTFRATDGLWENHRVEDVATPDGYARDPQTVLRFYNDRRRHILEPAVKPNPAHYALARLEARLGDNLLLVTQNIDNLHERAGNRRVVHMHGELLKARCPRSQKVYECTGDLDIGTLCSCCQPAQQLRPNIVWFNEVPLALERIYQAVEDCDYFIAIGTSGHVYPAAGLVQLAKQYGAHTIELNLEPSLVENQFAEKHYGLATKTVPFYISGLLRERKQTI